MIVVVSQDTRLARRLLHKPQARNNSKTSSSSAGICTPHNPSLLTPYLPLTYPLLLYTGVKGAGHGAQWPPQPSPDHSIGPGSVPPAATPADLPSLQACCGVRYPHCRPVSLPCCFSQRFCVRPHWYCTVSGRPKINSLRSPGCILWDRVYVSVTVPDNPATLHPVHETCWWSLSTATGSVEHSEYLTETLCSKLWKSPGTCLTREHRRYHDVVRGSIQSLCNSLCY